MRAQKAALTQLTIGPANRIAMHKHPGAEVLYVLEGHARILGPTGVAPEKLDEGMAILIPGGMPHAIENMGRTSSAVMLQVFAPMGPERVYRDPKDEAGRAAFEVIRDPSKAAPGGRQADRRRAPRDGCPCSRARGRSSRCSSPPRRAAARCTSACWRQTPAPRCRATATRDRRRSCTCCRAAAR